MTTSLKKKDIWFRAWALWKATYELCQIEGKDSQAALLQKTIISTILGENKKVG